MALNHKKVSAKTDGADNSLIQPSNWNDTHTVDGGVNELLRVLTGGEVGSSPTLLHNGSTLISKLTNGQTLNVYEVHPFASSIPLLAITNTGNILVPDDAYNAATWDGNFTVPTKNAIRDKIETMGNSAPVVNSYIASQSLALDTINLFAPTVNIVATLPTAVGNTGRTITVQKTNSNVFTVTMATTSGQTINESAASTVVFDRDGMSLDFFSDGSNWRIK